MIIPMIVLSCMSVFASSCEHLFDSIVTEPDCTNDGYTTHTCIICGYEYIDEIIPHTDHDIITEEILPPTCDTPGLSAQSHCNICGEIFTDTVDIPPTGHEWNIITESKKSLSEYKCTKCGDKINKDSWEYVNLETSRLLSKRTKELSMEEVVMELYELYNSLNHWDKPKVENAESLILSAEGFILYRMGDVDLSGNIDSKDLSMLLGDYAKYNKQSDITSDSVTNWQDLSVLLSNYGIKENI